MGNRVWNDANRNGIQDVDETGIEGATISAASQDGALLSTTTDSNGNYTLAGLMPYTPYTISFKLPTGYTFTFANINQDDTDSDADPTTGLIRGLVIWPGEINNTIDAGAYEILPRRTAPSPTPPPSPTPKLPSISTQPESSVPSNNASAYTPPRATRAPTIASAPRTATTPRQSASPQAQIVRRPVQIAPAAQPQTRPVIVGQNPAMNGVRPPAPVIPPNAVLIPPVNSATSPRSVLILQGP
ncbi:MAG: carboxypeptidase regulatory-like domain-containing protein [Anaerolineae bacterium]|nr:carboxypeptidase regulatory-like domain-containing protein [Anaerolineae bacterium]